MPEWVLPWKPPVLEDRVFNLPGRIWMNTLHQLAARHVKVPRSASTGVPGSQHPDFSVRNSPIELVVGKCERAGLVEEQIIKTKGTVIRTWKGNGPMTAYNFLVVDLFKVCLPHGAT